MRFLLGTHQPAWLGRTDVPLFVSYMRLRPYKALPRARGEWCLDSGGFSQLRMHGRWTVTARDYAIATRRYADEIGGLLWAAPQDWMCEPPILAKTGLNVAEHQARTIRSVLELRALEPRVHWIAVLQGWTLDDYLRHLERYAHAGIDLRRERVVGLGTICRRQATAEAEQIVRRLTSEGVQLHGFGLKTLGLQRVGMLLASADSMAWSFHARRKRRPLCGGVVRHKNCANCLPYALAWREGVLGH